MQQKKKQSKDEYIGFIMLVDGRLEWKCEHDIGHTVAATKRCKTAMGKYWISHGCDGCCSKKKFNIEQNYTEKRYTNLIKAVIKLNLPAVDF